MYDYTVIDIFCLLSTRAKSYMSVPTSSTTYSSSNCIVCHKSTQQSAPLIQLSIVSGTICQLHLPLSTNLYIHLSCLHQHSPCSSSCSGLVNIPQPRTTNTVPVDYGITSDSVFYCIDNQ